MSEKSFNPDLPSAIVGLISLILAVSVLDAGIARRWVGHRRRKAARKPITRRTFAYAYGIGYLMLICGLSALVLALWELFVETNKLDLILLVLTCVPIVGLGSHFASRLREDLGELPRKVT